MFGTNLAVELDVIYLKALNVGTGIKNKPVQAIDDVVCGSGIISCLLCFSRESRGVFARADEKGDGRTGLGVPYCLQLHVL